MKSPLRVNLNRMLAVADEAQPGAVAAGLVVACSPSTRSISLHNSSGRTAHRIALDHHADRDRPEPPRGRVGIAQRLPAVPLDLAGIGAQPLAVQPLDGALDQRREILAAARQRQRFGKEGDRIRRRHALDQRARIFPRRLRLQRRLLGRARHIQHVAAGGLDEQRLLGAEVIGDLARKGVGGGRDIRDRGAGQAPLLEQAAGAVEQARAHLASGRAGGADGVLGVAGRHFGSCLDGFGSHLPSRIICMIYKQISQERGRLSDTAAGASAGRPGNPGNKPCQRAQNPYKPRIRGSRPGAERTVSAISPFRRIDVAGPVGPSSRASAF